MKKIILNEANYKLLVENDLSDNFEKLKLLIESGQKDNIELAFQIGEGMEQYIPNFNFENWFRTEYSELLEFLIKIGLTYLQVTWLPTLIEHFLYVLKLEVIRIDGKSISALPKDIVKLKNLYLISLKSNNFEEFPIELCSMPELKYILLNDNKINTVPSCIAKLKKLESLDLRNNNIPESDYKKISKLHPTAIIRFEDNVSSEKGQLHYYKQ